MINIEQVKEFYPDLYSYYSTPLGVSINVPDWVTEYIGNYKKAKISNKYTQEIEAKINELNKDEVSFEKWYQQFSTTRTLLQGRGDIEIFYWIDGLGIEWIPLIKEIIKEKQGQNIFLNEIKIARSILPSITEVNKIDLQKLIKNGAPLMKEGDLDSHAHQSTNTWPNTIIEEIRLVRDIIEEITSKYNGKKIAIVSDHGLTYLSQLCNGIGLTGVEPDHHGRIAVKHNGKWTADSNYMRLEDNKTVCALKHNSLCNKVPIGQGIHGGCTPEEVLVPIFILSSYVVDAQWTADILTLELSGANPVVQFQIKNIPTTEIPVVEYNNKRYALHQTGIDLYETDPLEIDEQCNQIILSIGSVIRPYIVSVKTGAQTNDLFDF
jgi:hypothetical protein